MFGCRSTGAMALQSGYLIAKPLQIGYLSGYLMVPPRRANPRAHQRRAEPLQNGYLSGYLSGYLNVPPRQIRYLSGYLTGSVFVLQGYRGDVGDAGDTIPMITATVTLDGMPAALRSRSRRGQPRCG